MSQLPDPETEVTLAEVVAVSRAYHLLDGGCARLAFLSRGGLRLSGSIAAERGNLIHLVYEVALGGQPVDVDGQRIAFDVSGPATAVAVRAFDLAVDVRRGFLGRSHPHLDLTKTASTTDWEAFRAGTIRRVADYVRAMPVRPALMSAGGGVPPTIGNIVVGRTYPELPVRSPSLPVAGRADSVMLDADGTLWIHDHKSGRIFETDGRVKREYILQLALYGYAALEIAPERIRTLALTLAGSDGNARIEEEVARSAFEAFRVAVSRWTPGDTLPAEQVTTVGRSCRSCDVRHRCAKYLGTAPELRSHDRGDRDWEYPYDVWGEVTRVVPRGSVRTLDIRDAAEFRRTILRVSDRHVALREIEVGSRAALFGLARSDADRREPFPRNFHELDPSRDRQAWTVDAFVM